MTIVFYEKEYCEEILKNGLKKIQQRDLNYLAKYWNYLGNNEKEIENNLIQFCQKNDVFFNPIIHYNRIRRASLHARNNKLRFPTPIHITKVELDSIQTIDDYKIQKFLFIMIVVAKFFKYHQSRKKIYPSKYDQYLYSNISIKELKGLAGIKFTSNKWKKTKQILTKRGLINPTIINSKKWVVAFWNELSPVEIIVNDYRNPIVYYQEYCGELVIDCVECGTKIVKKSNRHSYCSSCWISHRNEKRIEYNRKYYINNVNKNI